MIFKKNLGIIISLTDGVGSIQHARDTYTEQHNVKIKEKEVQYNKYKRYDNVEIIKNTKANNRFSIKLRHCIHYIKKRMN